MNTNKDKYSSVSEESISVLEEAYFLGSINSNEDNHHNPTQGFIGECLALEALFSL